MNGAINFEVSLRNKLRREFEAELETKQTEMKELEKLVETLRSKVQEATINVRTGI